jgi:hypothetical protein
MYWSEEPWGPYRDNLHAALIVSELLRPHLKEGATLNTDSFMLRPRAELDALARARFVAQLTAVADRPQRAKRKRPCPI